MPVTLKVCSRCRTAAEPNDRFCQECGQELPSQAQIVISKPRRQQVLAQTISVPANSQSQACLAPAAAPTAAAMDVQGAQAAAEATAGAPQTTADAKAPAPTKEAPKAAAIPDVQESAPTHLHSPLLQGNGSQAPELGASPRLLSLLDRAAIAAVLAFAGALAFWAVGLQKKAENSLAASQAAEAQRHFQLQRFSLVADTLDQLGSSRKLDEQQQAMLDESHFQLGIRAAKNGHRQPAIDHLEQIGSSGARHLQAHDMLLRLVNPPVVEEVVQEPKTQSKPSTSRRILSEKKVLSFPVLPELNPADEGDDAELIEIADRTSEAPRKIAQMLKAKFSEKDLSVYNQMLASYLSRGKRDQEPPTFKDWLQNGRASF